MIDEPLEDIRFTAVNTGVPHAVTFTDDIDDINLERIGPLIRYHDRFPAGANVTIAAPYADGYRQRTYERGVEGETVACGTGAVAIAAVATHLEIRAPDQPIPVSPPGGELVVTIHPDGTATLNGPVTKTATGNLTDPPKP